MKSFIVISKNVVFPWANNIFSILLLKYEDKLFQSIYKDKLFQSYNNFMDVVASLCLSDSHSGECIIKYFHFFSQEKGKAWRWVGKKKNNFNNTTENMGDCAAKKNHAL